MEIPPTFWKEVKELLLKIRKRIDLKEVDVKGS